ncbi:MAG: hypothetical protein A3D74_00730 [Candidatus Levybacteria bacterium RIFCSPHIGHO2_02_FULL_37_13]|nr:MAG: hypothetical protein A3D74_00730 [Candidatus Levybacteria bacterium RIFCSPHIGHO2_02_FULL_37_13]OGH37945.1 MAG: hypothetical protein A3B41_05025 [Candidatus Levybacteria bacterium RIFCSPLOWO2_01_FULL_37_26]
MRILILNWRDIKHPLAGGAEIATHEHAKEWVRRGHEVTQFSSSIKGESAFDTIDGVKIIRRGNHYTVHIRAFFYYIMNLRQKIDLVVDEFHFIPFFTPLYVSKKKMAIIHETAEEVWFKNQGFPINILGFFIEPFFFKLYASVPFMTVSESTKKDLMRFGIKSKNIHIVNCGATIIESKNKKEKNPTLIYLGRLAKDKATEDALMAFYYTQKTFKDTVLWIVGREEMEGYSNTLREITKKLHIEKKVIFFDYVSEKKKFDLLKKAWILIHPSVKEGWGLTVVEAASQGTPTVAYNTSGLRDSIVHNKTGILVDDRKPESLANSIVELIGNSSLYNNLSSNAYRWSKSFKWEDSVQKSVTLIESIT